MTNVYLLHTIRAGEPSQWHVITQNLADRLNLDDPWLGMPQRKSKHVLAAYVTYHEALKAAEGHTIIDVIGAIGY